MNPDTPNGLTQVSQENYTRLERLAKNPFNASGEQRGASENITVSPRFGLNFDFY